MDFGDDDEDSGGPGLDLTGFLFGNINEKGELEDSDVLDSESCRQLIHLGSFGPFGKMVRDIDSTVRDEGASSDENEQFQVRQGSCSYKMPCKPDSYAE
eukprot:m.260196 g.260196  ORF g.260196 m.260196 type:complete len:99 (+) comp40432_c1_seq18:167-463(+)